MSKKATHGGARKGAGRKLGSGEGPSKDARVNRVAIMLNNKELKSLKAGAKRAKLPPSTYAYQLMSR